KWTIEYKYLYESQDNNFVLILEELHENKYCIVSNNMLSTFSRKLHVKEFVYFVKSLSYVSTRIDNYNEILNQKIIANMFLHVKPDVDALKVKSQVIDPKYLRNEIYIIILVRFQNLLEKKKKIRNIYDY